MASKYVNLEGELLRVDGDLFGEVKIDQWDGETWHAYKGLASDLLYNGAYIGLARAKRLKAEITAYAHSNKQAERRAG